MRAVFLACALALPARADDAFAFMLSPPPEGYQCLRAAGPLPSFPDVSFSEDVTTLPDGTVLVARGPDGVSAFTPGGALRSTVKLDARQLSLQGSRLWVRGDGVGLAVLDVSNPDQLSVLTTWTHHPLVETLLRFSAPRAILAEGPRLWATWGGVLEVYEVSTPEGPVRLARHALQIDVERLFRRGDLLVLQHLSSVSLWKVKNPAEPVVLGTLEGRVIADDETLWLLDHQVLSRLELRDDAAPNVVRVGELGPHEGIAAITGGRVFVRHDPRSLAVLALPSLDFVGALSGNFETGYSPAARNGDTLYLSTRFGGVQRIALDQLSVATPTRRFAGVPLQRNRFHGDVIFVTVAPGDSIAAYLRRFALDDPSPTWAARLEPLRRLNVGCLPDFPLLRPGDRVGVPLPRSLICRP